MRIVMADESEPDPSSLCSPVARQNRNRRMRLDRLKPGSRFIRRNRRRMPGGALAINSGESFIGASSTYASRGCQSARAAGSLVR